MISLAGSQTITRVLSTSLANCDAISLRIRSKIWVLYSMSGRARALCDVQTKLDAVFGIGSQQGKTMLLVALKVVQ